MILYAPSEALPFPEAPRDLQQLIIRLRNLRKSASADPAELLSGVTAPPVLVAEWLNTRDYVVSPTEIALLVGYLTNCIHGCLANINAAQLAGVAVDFLQWEEAPAGAAARLNRLSPSVRWSVLSQLVALEITFFAELFSYGRERSVDRMWTLLHWLTFDLIVSNPSILYMLSASNIATLANADLPPAMETELAGPLRAEFLEMQRRIELVQHIGGALSRQFLAAGRLIARGILRADETSLRQARENLGAVAQFFGSQRWHPALESDWDELDGRANFASIMRSFNASCQTYRCGRMAFQGSGNLLIAGESRSGGEILIVFPPQGIWFTTETSPGFLEAYQANPVAALNRSSWRPGKPSVGERVLAHRVEKIRELEALCRSREFQQLAASAARNLGRRAMDAAPQVATLEAVSVMLLRMSGFHPGLEEILLTTGVHWAGHVAWRVKNERLSGDDHPP